MLLTSTLIAVLLLGLLAFVLGVAIGCTLAWTQGRLPWAGSDLPADPLDDPGFDYAMNGWWIDDPEWYSGWPRVAPDGLVRRWAYKTHGAAQTQFLLTVERVESPLTVQQLMDGARR